MPEYPVERAVISTTEAGRILSVTNDTIVTYVKTGKLEAFSLPGGHFRIYRDSVEALMEAPVE